MNYCRRCSRYYLDTESCNCPPGEGLEEGDRDAQGSRGTGADPDLRRNEIGTAGGGDAVRTGLFD